MLNDADISHFRHVYGAWFTIYEISICDFVCRSAFTQTKILSKKYTDFLSNIIDV